MAYNVDDTIFIWDDETTPRGTLILKDRHLPNQRLQAPSYYRVVSEPTAQGLVQVRKLDEVGAELLDNPNYLYFIQGGDIPIK